MELQVERNFQVLPENSKDIFIHKFVEPTVFADATGERCCSNTDNEDNMKIVTDEIFGPVMIVLKFKGSHKLPRFLSAKDVKEVIDRVNNTMYGLTAGIQTRDTTKALAVASNIQAGTVRNIQ